MMLVVVAAVMAVVLNACKHLSKQAQSAATPVMEPRCVCGGGQEMQIGLLSLALSIKNHVICLLAAQPHAPACPGS